MDIDKLAHALGEVASRPMFGDLDLAPGRAAAERDGGVIEAVLSIERNRPAIKCTLGDTNADIILVVGGTGRGATTARRRR
jgi:hypothetical protein